MNKLLYYKDICFHFPQYSEVESRSDLINSGATNIEFCGKKFKSCAIPANMKTTISFKKAEELSEAGYFYILHRFYDYNEIKEWICNNQNLRTISISIGVQSKDYGLVDWIVYSEKRVDFITIDVAHGDCERVQDMIRHIKSYFGAFKQDPKIIAGNVISPDAVYRLAKAGVHGVKVGIAGGAACSTKNVTGVFCPQFSAVLNCVDWKKKLFPAKFKDIYAHYGTTIPLDLNINRKQYHEFVSSPEIDIIADGGVREIADYSKALVAGAKMVMAGSEFAKLKDSPAPRTKDKKVEYFGSASAKNQGHNSFVEGFENKIEEVDLTYLEYLDKVNQGVASCMSYHNLKNISQMRDVSWGIC